jgi:hypothetical protein
MIPEDKKCNLHKDCACEVGHAGTCNDRKGNWFWMPFECKPLKDFKIDVCELPYIRRVK